MEESKKWYASETIIGGIVMFLMFLVTMFKFDLDKGLITEFITRLFQLISTVMIIHGRLTAKKVLTK